MLVLKWSKVKNRQYIMQELPKSEKKKKKKIERKREIQRFYDLLVGAWDFMLR